MYMTHDMLVREVQRLQQEVDELKRHHKTAEAVGAGAGAGSSTDGAHFYVALTQTGGSAGNTSTACSFTYTVTDVNGVTLLTGAAPLVARPTKGKLVAAAYGIGYRDGSGTVQLLFAFEPLAPC